MTNTTTVVPGMGTTAYYLSRGIRLGIKPLDERGPELLREFTLLEEARSYGLPYDQARYDQFKKAAGVIRRYETGLGVAR
jgi:hypothetical protein